jgi:linoleoyl-CoA desaturase
MSKEANQDFARLRQQIHRLGFGRKTTAIIIGECVLFVALVIAGVALVATSENIAVKAIGMCLVAYGCMGLSTNGHTASHHAISSKAWINEFIMYFDFPFFLGVSGNYWRHKHVVIHHPHPNVIGLDDDADLMPVFTLNDRDLKNASGLKKWWLEHQGYFFPIVLLGNSFGVAFKGWRFLIRELLDDQRRSWLSWVDLACMIAHWIVWTIIPIYVFGFANVAMFFIVQMFMMSYVMFLLFAPAHYPDEAIQVTKDATLDNYLMLQTATAVNFETGPIGRLLCAGVDFQIEHHLFPWISPRHYPALAPVVRQFCEEHGYPYRSQGWGVATWKSVATLFRPKKILEEFPAIENLPLAAHYQQQREDRREAALTLEEDSSAAQMGKA